MPCSWPAQETKQPPVVEPCLSPCSAPCASPQDTPSPSCSATSAFVQHTMTCSSWKGKSLNSHPTCPLGLEQNIQSRVTTELTWAPLSASSFRRAAHLLRFFPYKAKFGSSWAILSLDFLAVGLLGPWLIPLIEKWTLSLLIILFKTLNNFLRTSLPKGIYAVTIHGMNKSITCKPGPRQASILTVT